MGGAQDLVPQAPFRRLDWDRMAARIRRPRRRRDAGGGFSRGIGPLQRSPALYRRGRGASRTDPDSMGSRGAEKKIYSQNSLGRRNLVPGLFGTQRRFRSDISAHDGG